MSVINNVSSVFKGFNVVFNEAFKTAEALWPKIAMETKSMSREEVYLWLGEFPQMREWVGDRFIKDLESFEYVIKNKKFEAAIKLKGDDIADNTLSGYTPRVQEMARSAKKHPDKLVFQALSAGFTSLCWDGQYFFDTDHPVGGTSVSNFQGGTGTAWYLMDLSRYIKPIVFQTRQALKTTNLDKPTDERAFMRDEYVYGVDARHNVGYGFWQLAYASKETLNATNYAAAKAAFESQKDSEGEPLDITATTLVYPPSLESAARTLIEAQTDATGASNIWYKDVELLKVQRLA